MDPMARIDERYTTFTNIDCFQNACKVVDHLLRVLEDKQYMNAYWEKNVPLIPQAYHEPENDSLQKEDLLYFVCSKLFYIEELFEEAEDEEAENIIKMCEMECC